MTKPLGDGVRNRLVLAAGASVAAGAALLWLVLSDRAVPDQAGIVRFDANGPASTTPAKGTATSMSSLPAGTTITVLGDPADLHALVLSEARDALWADRVEATIRNNMRGFPFLGSGSPLDVRCAATVCEIRGVATADSLDAVKRVWQELEQFTQGDALSDAGLLSAASTFGTRETPYAFVLHYRRDDDLAATR